MNTQQIEAAMAKAKAAHAELPPGARPSVDALFIVAYLQDAQQAKRGYTRKTEPNPPQWFVDGLRNHGKFSATASVIMSSVKGRMATLEEVRQCGAWLRQLGFKPYKSNGRLIFAIG